MAKTRHLTKIMVSRISVIIYCPYASSTSQLPRKIQHATVSVAALRFETSSNLNRSAFDFLIRHFFYSYSKLGSVCVFTKLRLLQ